MVEELVIMFKELDYKSKIEVMKKYAKTNKGKGLAATLDRLLIEAVVLFVSTVVIIGAVFIADLPKWWLGVSGITLIFGLIFFLSQLNIQEVSGCSIPLGKEQPLWGLYQWLSPASLIIRLTLHQRRH